MLIAIDVGNTNMVFGIFEGENLVGSFRLMTDVNRTSDEIGLSAYEYFHRFGWSADQVEDVIIASVVPSVMYSLTSAMVKYFNRTPLVVDVDIDPALPYVESDSDERLGADRAVACIAAMTKYGKPLIVLDFGTATTVDAVNADGVYQGGCISAGLRVSTEALFSKAAMLPHVELVKPPKALNTTAVGQIQAGAVGGYIGAMEYLIRQVKDELGYGGHVKVVATGGLARLIADNCPLIDAVDPQLILDGLLLLYRRYLSQRDL